MLEKDPLANVMFVDLTKKAFRVERQEALFDAWIGGTGVATQLISREIPAGADPLDPENTIVLAIGPATGLYPLASKTVAMFKSPLTGDLGESHCGGRSAVSIRNARLGAIVIKGKSDIPVYVSISNGEARFVNATTLWGMNSTYTAGKIIRQAETGAGTRTIMRIGRAGERMVRYACVTSETYRHFGRLGLGAVFGSKNLKAVVVSGKATFPVTDIKAYKTLYDELYKSAVESPLMKKYHDIGTPININILNGIGALPTRNVTSGKFEHASSISGEHLAEHFLGRRLACTGCPVACIHIAALREPYDDEPYFYKTSMISYDHELIYALGSMLGIGDPEHFLKLMDAVERAGLDAITTGASLAWATEALEKQLITKGHTLGLDPTWGDYKSYMAMVKHVVNQPNEFYADLAKGSYFASKKYGGREFSMTFGKNEMAGYHTGPACYIGYSIGARHSHLDNAGYAVDQKTLMEKQIPPESVTDQLVKEEEWRQVISSLTACFFARNMYTPSIVARVLSLSGYTVNEGELARIGRDIHRAKFAFKAREGFVIDGDDLPARIYETPSPVPFLNQDYVKRALQRFKGTVMERRQDD